ncbi:MAG: PIN domain-containing protein [Chloroflexota bacterium]
MGIVVLDAGVVVAALDATDLHHDASTTAIRASLAAGHRLVMPASAYAECLVWPYRAGETAVSTADAFIDALPATVLAADRDIARTAARLRAEHGPTLRLPDALVIATALETGADQVLTTDRGWPATEVAVEVVGAPSSPARTHARSRASRSRP